MEKLIIEPTVGYMLKVLKSGVDITKFKSEFDAIKHGNYDEFIDLIGAPKGEVVVAMNGVISTENISQKSHFDFAALAVAGPSLRQFFKDCVSEYGKTLSDSDISNEVYGKAALFELSLRMHANNYKLIDEREKLFEVIKKISNLKGILPAEEEQLQKGRQFINDVKHHNEPDYKRKFPTWEAGVAAFEVAYKIVENYKLTII